MTRQDPSAAADRTGADRAVRLIRRAIACAGVQARSVFRIFAAVAVGGMLLANVDVNDAAAATVVPLLAGVYVLVTTVMAWPRALLGSRSRRSDHVRATLDIVAVCAVAVSVTEPRVSVLLILCAVPLGYGLTLPAASVMVLTATAVAGCMGVWATGPLFGGPGIAEGSLVLLAFAIAWSGLMAGLIAMERERRAARITRLSGSVRDMLRQALRAEANERARVADLLHDDVLQLLMTTRHDISDAIDGDLDLLPDARAGLEAATLRLRDTIGALRDEGTGELPLSEALTALAEEPHDARGTTVEVRVSRRVGVLRHPVLVAAARDLVRDAESSSAAARVTVTAEREDETLVLVVRHDDRRFTLGLEITSRSAGALDDVAARVHALDGTFDAQHGADGERVLTIRVPVLTGRRGTGGEDTTSWSPAAAFRPTPKLG